MITIAYNNNLFIGLVASYFFAIGLTNCLASIVKYGEEKSDKEWTLGDFIIGIIFVIITIIPLWW